MSAAMAKTNIPAFAWKEETEEEFRGALKKPYLQKAGNQT